MGNTGNVGWALTRIGAVLLCVTGLTVSWAAPSYAATTATVCLVDSTGNGISGAEAEFRFGTWQPMGPTGSDGCVGTDSPSAVGNRAFRVTYNGQTKQKTQNTTLDPVVAFSTILVTGQLLDSTGAGLEGALIEYAAGGWKSLGMTDTTGQATREMLAASLPFRVTYGGQTERKTQDIGIDPVVSFSTILVTGQLLDSTGAGIEGALIEYAAGGWKSLGSTDATGQATREMLAASLPFRVTYGGQTERKTQDTTVDPVVGYQTGKVLQGTGARVLRYRASGWQIFLDGIELLPGDVVFDLDVGPNETHTVIAGSSVYVPTAPTTPLVIVGSDLSGDEGAVIPVSATYTDVESAQSHTATIDWGDASALEPGVVTAIDGLGGQVDSTHVYADEGVYTITVCVTDNGNPDATGCAGLAVTVANVAPVVVIYGEEAPDLGSEVTFTSEVTDSGWGDTIAYEWVVTRDAVIVASGSDPTLAFTPDSAGEYLVTLTVDDGDGGTGSDGMMVTIADVEPPEEPPTEPPVEDPESVEEDPTPTRGIIASEPGEEPAAPEQNETEAEPSNGQGEQAPLEPESTSNRDQESPAGEPGTGSGGDSAEPETIALPAPAPDNEVAALFISADAAAGPPNLGIDRGFLSPTSYLLLLAAISTLLVLLGRRLTHRD